MVQDEDDQGRGVRLRAVRREVDSDVDGKTAGSRKECLKFRRRGSVVDLDVAPQNRSVERCRSPEGADLRKGLCLPIN